ncbi:uncharacterized protein EI90DRAFT_964119 [Cantharellus anzutake]|uniref:uncharacterized protein n=1 Tax=Cantharellus anzutake TaxID=1750568 RepID=UPI0019081CF2|nr:uncharacterized protein EI90DRAFT_964119 [Cantharellus anzutake]KAF8331749.1 hypothetical protein EI90DRAFT_964119 [Cantharellus anzutake]
MIQSPKKRVRMARRLHLKLIMTLVGSAIDWSSLRMTGLRRIVLNMITRTSILEPRHEDYARGNRNERGHDGPKLGEHFGKGDNSSSHSIHPTNKPH